MRLGDEDMKLEILPGNQVIEIKPGETILQAIRKDNSISFESPCNGKGSCGKCKIILREGTLSPMEPAERRKVTTQEVAAGYRLACYAQCVSEEGTLVIEFPKGAGKSVVLAEAEYEKTVKEQLFYVPGEMEYGIAVDIGTTTVAAVLLDLKTGDVLAKTSAINPQTTVGGDVLSRIAHTMMTEDGLEQLQKMIVDELNRMSGEMLQKTGLNASCIAGYSIAANCTMLHLLLGVDPQSLSRVPFKPVFTEGQMMPASQIGLLPENPKTMLYCLPSISAYIGADIVAGIYRSGIFNTDKNIMFIDIGTNGEIVLSQKGKMFGCSCAAGPAMEGMNITCGMRAAEGAVEGVSYSDGEIRLKVIGDIVPKGICGSGVLETVAMLLNTRSMSASGKVEQENSLIKENFFRFGKSIGYYLHKGDVNDNIYFNQHDIRQIQLAKGAILSGFCALIEKSGLSFEELDQVIIAGQFGSHLKAETLIDIGILPQETRGKVSYIGNSSLSGAISCLLDKSLTDLMEKLARKVDYMELGNYPHYDKLLMKCMMFPEN